MGRGHEPAVAQLFDRDGAQSALGARDGAGVRLEGKALIGAERVDVVLGVGRELVLIGRGRRTERVCPSLRQARRRPSRVQVLGLGEHQVQLQIVVGRLKVLRIHAHEIRRRAHVSQNLSLNRPFNQRTQPIQVHGLDCDQKLGRRIRPEVATQTERRVGSFEQLHAPYQQVQRAGGGRGACPGSALERQRLRRVASGGLRQIAVFDVADRSWNHHREHGDRDHCRGDRLANRATPQPGGRAEPQVFVRKDDLLEQLGDEETLRGGRSSLTDRCRGQVETARHVAEHVVELASGLRSAR